jgi:hypothetical protein
MIIDNTDHTDNDDTKRITKRVKKRNSAMNKIDIMWDTK